MKYLKFYLLIFTVLVNILSVQAQYKWWGGYTINQVVEKSDLIFEGRILTDSAFFAYPAGHIFTLHQVLVLKKFKGNFISDTVHVVTWGGRAMINGQSDRTPGEYSFKGDEALIFATNSTKVDFGGSDSTTYDPFYGPGVSYVTVCNKKDVVKEVYEPIEAVTGQKYIDIHPNNCKEWQEAHKKKPTIEGVTGTPVKVISSNLFEVEATKK